MPPLNRFHAAQDQPHAGFRTALLEIEAGAKRGHWIWYLFPQLAGLGTSALAREYAIVDVTEATAYLRDDVLRDRLLTLTRAVAEQVERGVPLRTLMGSHIDAVKLVSSLTLFVDVARRLESTEHNDAFRSIHEVAEQVLEAATREGLPRCAYTLQRLAENGR